MPAMDVMLVVIVMVIVLVVAILFAFQIKSSGQEQTFRLGGKMEIYGPGNVSRDADTVTATEIRFELKSEKEQNFDMVAIADYADSGGNRKMIFAGEDSSFTYGPIIPISSSDLSQECKTNYVFQPHGWGQCLDGHHPALDIYAPCGTPIRASCGGYLTKQSRSCFCRENDCQGDNYHYVQIINDQNCVDIDGSDNYAGYKTEYVGIKIRDDLSKECDNSPDPDHGITVSQGQIIGYVNKNTPTYYWESTECHTHFIISNDANFLDSTKNPAFVCSRELPSSGRTIIYYSDENTANLVDLTFDFPANSLPEKTFLHITFWACVLDKYGNCACIDDYMKKTDKILGGLIESCPSFYIGSRDASIET